MSRKSDLQEHIVIGQGEVGRAVHYVLSRLGPGATLHDVKEFEGLNSSPVESVHICFPWSETFIDEASRYRDYYRPRMFVVHSTVPVGTCGALCATHSPVVGMHPYLEESLLTFRKAVGGTGRDAVARLFLEAGMRVQVYRLSRTTELMKLLSTTKMFWEIAFNNAMLEQCQYHHVPEEAYHQWTTDYNDGYKAMGRPENVRPLYALIQGPPGGHCLIDNVMLLNMSGELNVTEYLIERLMYAAAADKTGTLRGVLTSCGILAPDQLVEPGEEARVRGPTDLSATISGSSTDG